jgi:hypothetical protein
MKLDSVAIVMKMGWLKSSYPSPPLRWGREKKGEVRPS